MRATMRTARLLGMCCGLLALGLAVPVAADDGDIVITITGGKFVPSEVPVAAGKKLKLVVRNQDATTSEFESVDFHREKIVESGDAITVFVGPLDAGSYEFFDDFHPDDRGHLVAK
jgi:plastocyanin